MGRCGTICAVAVLMCGLAAVPAAAASKPLTEKNFTFTAERAVESKKSTGTSGSGWKLTKNGYTYKMTDGSLVKASSSGKYAVREIKGKKYAFDEAGLQVHGWRKIGKKYYFFRMGQNSSGYMEAGKTVYGIPLSESGAAAPVTARQKKKVKLMAEYRAWADEITEKDPMATRINQLRTVFDYLRKLPYRYVSGYRKEDSDWDIWGADFVRTRGYFDCHPIAAAFAYLANAIGYEDVQICTLKYWHSFTRVNGKYYDTSLARHDVKLSGDKKYRKFAMSNYYARSDKIIKDISE